MIKKFNEYIEEGLWKSGIERSKTGVVRKEDLSIVDRLLELPDDKKEIVTKTLFEKLRTSFPTTYTDMFMDVFNITPLYPNSTRLKIMFDKYTLDECITKFFKYIDECINNHKIPDTYEYFEEVINEI